MTDLSQVTTGTISASTIREELQKALDRGDIPLALVALSGESVYVFVAGVPRGQTLAEAIMKAIIDHDYVQVQ